MAGTRVPALAAVAILLVATATGDGPAGPPDVSLSLSGQSPDPAGPARLEASGESDFSTAAHLGKAVTSLAFPGSPLATEPRDPPRDSPPGGDPGSDSGSDSAHPLRGAPPGPDVPSQSSESEEGRERDPDSEEALPEHGI